MGINQIAADMYEAMNHESKSFADPMKPQFYEGFEVNIETVEKLVNLVKKYQNELHYKNEAFSKIMKLFSEYSKFLNDLDIDNCNVNSNDIMIKHWRYGLKMSKEFHKIMDEMLKDI